MAAGGADPPGVRLEGGGAWFGLRSEHAEAVELCLFDSLGQDAETRRIALERGADGRWRTFVPGVGPGQRYAYRVHGPFLPALGHRFNPAKLVMDPYAAALDGEGRAHEALTGESPDDGRPDPRDSAPYAPRCLVVDPAFDWQGVQPPRTSAAETVVYECHVRGLTRRHPEVPEPLRGTYLGLAAEPVIAHLRRLGATAVELLPVQQFVSERPLLARGLRNYWGYNPLGLFAPHAAYATAADGRQVTELKTLVRELHRAGLEVILDVVFNHTCEGGRGGPTLCWRGIDNLSYYRLQPGDPSRYDDLSGCGNTLDARRPAVLGMILDCLRHWVEEYRIDGFRFDLAAALGRGEADFDARSPFFEALAADAGLAGIKLIAEPWDARPGGYALGGFPPPWAEWNDRYRDTLRGFWRGDAVPLGRVTDALAGSPGIFAASGRGAAASVNYVACHDGFTLADQVSYETKRNQANGEDNRDGHEPNLSRNWGVEGETEREDVLERREQVKRSMLATLALAAGVPMLGHGDELGRTQRGNNNAYCQDNEVSWVDWELDARRRALVDFTVRLFALRRRLAVAAGGRRYAVTPDGLQTALPEAPRSRGRSIGLLTQGPAGEWLLLLNGAESARPFRLPERPGPGGWRILLSSAAPPPRQARLAEPPPGHPAGATLTLPAHAAMVLLYDTSLTPHQVP